MTEPTRIRTERMELILGDAAMLRADAGNREPLSLLLGATIPADWPPELFAEDRAAFAAKLESGEWDAGMAPWYWVLDDGASPRTLIGSGGLMPIGSAGDVMCGYSVVPSFYGRGLATEAMRALVGLAFSRPGVERVIADTFPHLSASIRVMEKLGMTPIESGPEAGTVRRAVTKQKFAHAEGRGDGR